VARVLHLDPRHIERFGCGLLGESRDESRQLLAHPAAEPVVLSRVVAVEKEHALAAVAGEILRRVEASLDQDEVLEQGRERWVAMFEHGHDRMRAGRHPADDVAVGVDVRDGVVDPPQHRGVRARDQFAVRLRGDHHALRGTF